MARTSRVSIILSLTLLSFVSAQDPRREYYKKKLSIVVPLPAELQNEQLNPVRFI